MGVVVGVPAVSVVAYYFDRKALAVNVYFSVSTDQFIISMSCRLCCEGAISLALSRPTVYCLLSGLRGSPNNNSSINTILLSII